MNVSVRFKHRLEAQGEQTAIIDAGDREETYADLARQSRQVAAWLDERGLGTDDRIAVYMQDTPSYVPAVLGIWW